MPSGLSSNQSDNEAISETNITPFSRCDVGSVDDLYPHHTAVSALRDKLITKPALVPTAGI